MRISITIPEETDNEIAAYAAREKITKPEAVRRLLNVVKVSNQEHAKGRSLGVVVDEDNHLRAIGKLIGI